MKVTILSRREFADKFPNLKDDKEVFFISIVEPDDYVEFHPESTNYKTYSFYDLEDDIDNGEGHIYKAMSEEQAKDMFEFIKLNKDKEKLYVHCHAGISRSGAVGSFVHEYFGGAYKELLKTHPHILPNGRITRLLRMYERLDGEDQNYIKF